MTRTQIIDYLVPVLFDLFGDEGPWQDNDPIEWLEEMALDIVQDTYHMFPDRNAFFDVLSGELTSRGIMRQWPLSAEVLTNAVNEVMDWYEQETGQKDDDPLAYEGSEPFTPSLGRYTVILTEENPGHWRAQIREAHVCVAYGRTREEAVTRVRETLELFFADAKTAILDEELSQ